MKSDNFELDSHEADDDETVQNSLVFVSTIVGSGARSEAVSKRHPKCFNLHKPTV